ncbi:energy-coupling factor ABC transporter ATP-binding protein [Magnetospira sp. QH-2]|uniref:energy-coupling factor ABC transporter ATP-binding protein n=1 Tax=Magnetospira sp. (strain QH-2) TaxID=1288970 RepID=UPI0003E81A50|nr:ABC transporter ATP-binding protein [Magnetospira sp. QH-2]CCQ74211.1 Putative cobalt transport protein ATP-binding subunit CbiO [CbiO] [Magnetospira sp. QH-2]
MKGQTLPAMEVRGVTYRYPGGDFGLSDLNLTIRRRRRLAVLGANGSGKSTLLMHLNGALKPDKGEILLDDAPMGYGRAQLRDWRQRVGVVLQNPDDMLFATTVYEDVAYGPKNRGLPVSDVETITTRVLAWLDLSELADRPPHMLSYGQRKRVAIAGIVAMEPQVIVLDEPTAGLDSWASKKLIECLDRLEETGTTFVFATHDAHLVLEWADDVALFKDGSVVFQGTTTEYVQRSDRMDDPGIPRPAVFGFLDLLFADERFDAQERDAAREKYISFLRGSTLG